MTLSILNYQFLPEGNLTNFHQPTNMIIETVAYRDKIELNFKTCINNLNENRNVSLIKAEFMKNQKFTL